MHDHHNSVTPTRRTIAKGAAWTVPVVVAAAAAAPAMAASPTCTPCLGASLVSASETIATVRNNVGSVAIGGAFTAIATNCTGVITAGAAVIIGATLTTNLGTYTTTTGLTGGPMVAGVVALGSGLVFTGVDFPNGIYAAGSGPVRLVSLCFNLTIPLQIGGTSVACGQSVCFKPTVSLGLGVVTDTLVGAGRGIVTYTTGWTFLSN